MSMIETRGHWQDDDCGCGPGLRLDNIRDCWRQIAELKAIIADIIGEIGGPVKTGPIMGIVNGKAAAAGQVGEVMATTLNGNFTSAAQTQAISSIVLQPGDWQVAVTCSLDSEGADGNAGGKIALNPVPAGVQPIEAEFYTGGSSKVRSVGMNAQSAQVNITTPTLLAFTLTTNDPSYSSGSDDGGTWEVQVMARRMR
jgi:hypothetical protein